MNITKNEITIKVKFTERKNPKAIVSVVFQDFIIKGFRIQESPYANIMGKNLWLTPPSYQDSSGKYHPIFFMPKKEQWKKLELMIWNEYEKQEAVYYQKRFGISDEDMPLIKQ